MNARRTANTPRWVEIGVGSGNWQQTCLKQLSFSWERTAGVGIKNPVCIPSPAFFLPCRIRHAPCPVPGQCLCISLLFPERQRRYLENSGAPAGPAARIRRKPFCRRKTLHPAASSPGIELPPAVGNNPQMRGITRCARNALGNRKIPNCCAP